MKKINCMLCGCETEVFEDYEPEYCCPGGFFDACGCMGKPLNPVFCEKCEEIVYPKHLEVPAPVLNSRKRLYTTV